MNVKSYSLLGARVQRKGAIIQLKHMFQYKPNQPVETRSSMCSIPAT